MPRDTSFYVEGVRDLQRALKVLPRELSNEIRTASQGIADRGAAEIRQAASTPAERKAAKSVRSRRDRVPVIVAGGGVRTLGGAMFFGTEFGGRARPTTQQFRAHLGRQGYWFYPTVRRRGESWAQLWLDGVDDALSVWSN